MNPTREDVMGRRVKHTLVTVVLAVIGLMLMSFLAIAEAGITLNGID